VPSRNLGDREGYFPLEEGRYPCLATIPASMAVCVKRRGHTDKAHDWVGEESYEAKEARGYAFQYKFHWDPSLRG
jgi:hypothetical protein